MQTWADLRFFVAMRLYYFRQLLTRDGEWELRLLKRYGSGKALAVDIGANNGTYSYHMSRHFAEVVAFEPNPMFARFLSRLPARVKTQAVALSDHGGEGTLSIPVGSNGEAPGWASLEQIDSQARALQVPLRTLDSFDLAPSFIKIDVEGHEHAVLSGARATIGKHRPVVLVEVEERHRKGSVEALRQMMESWGYEGFFFEDGQQTLISAFDKQVHQPDLGVFPGKRFKRQELKYYNNFLFLPKQ